MNVPIGTERGFDKIQYPFLINHNTLNKWCWEDWTSTCERMKLGPYITHKNQLKID